MPLHRGQFGRDRGRSATDPRLSAKIIRHFATIGRGRAQTEAPDRSGMPDAALQKPHGEIAVSRLTHKAAFDYLGGVSTVR